MHSSVCYTHLKKQITENRLKPPFPSVLAPYPHRYKFCHNILLSFLDLCIQKKISASLLVCFTLLSIIFDELLT